MKSMSKETTDDDIKNLIKPKSNQIEFTKSLNYRLFCLLILFGIHLNA